MKDMGASHMGSMSEPSRFGSIFEKLETLLSSHAEAVTCTSDTRSKTYSSCAQWLSAARPQIFPPEQQPTRQSAVPPACHGRCCAAPPPGLFSFSSPSADQRKMTESPSSLQATTSSPLSGPGARGQASTLPAGVALAMPARGNLLRQCTLCICGNAARSRVCVPIPGKPT